MTLYWIFRSSNQTKCLYKLRYTALKGKLGCVLIIITIISCYYFIPPYIFRRQYASWYCLEGALIEQNTLKEFKCLLLITRILGYVSQNLYIYISYIRRSILGIIKRIPTCIYNIIVRKIYREIPLLFFQWKLTKYPR